MKKYIEVIGKDPSSGTVHPLFDETIDVNLRKYAMERFHVRLNKKTLENSIRMGKELAENELPHGALLMVGYVAGDKKIEDYFRFTTRDTPKKLNIAKNFKDTLEFVTEKAFSENEHDGAILINPIGEVKNHKVYFDPSQKKIYRSHGYPTYPSFKDDIGLRSDGRLCTAVTQSMIFVGSFIISISEDNPLRNFFVHNGQLFPIASYTIDQYYNNPPARFYRPPQHP